MNNVIVEYNIKNLSICIKTGKYKRVINCKDLDSYKEEIKRLYIDLIREV